ncbi:alanine racemase [Acetobacter conturbans]|uniref:Alanine racemase n=1 Tax=Acetobacter conturbans TaxID=1737472 RepID=A0ABX0JUE9_9PROT|nr:alanine racemase [Acetobacter conturbans]NHN87121.1 alanine racemase [Acetobacter conturbans]
MNVLTSAPAWAATRAGAVLTVNLDAIASNYRTLRKMCGDTACAAVVKADAYGLGAAQVAPALERAGAQEFFVAHVDEGIELRRYITPLCRITVLHGPRPAATRDCVRHSLRPVLNSPEQIEAWRQEAVHQGHPLDAVIQIDTGMSRFGLSPAQFRSLAEEPSLLAGIDVSLLMSHLACADAPRNEANIMQRQRMRDASALMPGLSVSLAASSGIFLGSDYHFSLVRPGAALYGIAPNAELAVNPLLPVLRLSARVLQIRTIGAGEGAGYGLTDRAQVPRRAAVVAIGYADGLTRHAAGEGCAWFGSTRLPILGRVSMDSVIVDISDVPEQALTQDMLVDLIGPHYGVDDAAQAAGTIGYEVLTSLGRRFHRDYIAS